MGLFTYYMVCITSVEINLYLGPTALEISLILVDFYDPVG